MSKSADAFRTISEVADWLGVHAHVLRFWESKFTQIKPVKRAGGRRYYRPVDMLLLGGIQKLLHEDGLTIKGVQKILREKGMAHVSALSKGLDDMDDAPTAPVVSATVPRTIVAPPVVAAPEAPSAMDVNPTEDDANVVNFMSGDASVDLSEDPDPATQRPSFIEDAVVMPDPTAPTDASDAPAPVAPVVTASEETAEPEAASEALPVDEPAEPDVVVETVAAEPEAQQPEPVVATPDISEPVSETPAPVVEDAKPVVEAEEPDIPVFMSASAKPEIVEEPETPADEHDATLPDNDTPEEPAATVLPSFMHRRSANPVTPALEEPDTQAEPTPEPAIEPQAPAQDAAEPAPAKPLIVDVPETPEEASFAATPSALSVLAKTKALSDAQIKDVVPLLAQLVAVRDRMVQARKE